jgi:HCOMODA/2-hydroxy-3-carboxy-muconic semialdehyde decarboxylase
MYGERFIHGEIYAARPDVNAIVHSHSPDVLPFTVTTVPFKALIHMAAFLGNAPAPVFEIRDAVGEDNKMLVTENRTGAALAAILGQRSVVLMRGHGMSVVAASVKEVVLRAIYTQLTARIETTALRMGEPNFLNAFEVERTDPVDRPWEAWAADA